MKRSFIGSALILFAVRIAGVSLLVGQVALVAISQDLEMVGINGILWSAAVIFRVAGPLGVDVMAMKEANSPTASYQEPYYVQRLAVRDTFSLLKIWVPILIIALGTWFFLAAIGVVDGILFPVLSVSCLASIFHRLWFMSLVARHKSFVSQFVESILLPVLAIAAVLLTPKGNETLFLLGQGASIVIVAMGLGAIALTSVSKGNSQLRPINWRGALTVALGASLTALAVRSPIFFVGGASVRLAGEYDIAQRFQSAGSIGVSAVSTALMPRLAKTIQYGRRRPLARLLILGSAASASIPIALLGGLLLVGSQSAATLLGSEYGPLWAPAVVLTSSALINSITSSVSNALSLGGFQKWFAWISALQLAFLVVAASLLHPPSTMDMAFVVLASEIIRSILLLLAFRIFVHRSMARHRAAD